MTLNEPVSVLKGVGPALTEKLAELGIETIRDLLYFFPRRYDDFSVIVPLKDIQPGAVTVRVKIEKVTARHVRRGMHITEAIIFDDTSKARAVWFNQSYRAKSLEGAGEVYMSGTFDFQRNRFVLQNPAVEKVAAFTQKTARIVPVYPLVKGLKMHQLYGLFIQVRPLMQLLPDSLPPVVRQAQQLLSLSNALVQVHFPENLQQTEAAKERLGFEELFAMLLAAQLNRAAIRASDGWSIAYDQSVAERFTKALGFTLTHAQRRASWEILQDISETRPMNRLLQGDVGAGKTAVAAFAAFMAASQGYQVAIMAPTEVLAAQHAESLAKLLAPLGCNVALLVGSVKPKPRQVLLDQIQQGTAQIIVGTHALIQGKVIFHKLGLVVIDEQHRFGVNQRRELLAHSERMPHLLAMTATPIPRSLNLTLYGELDISILDERPPGRTPIITEICSQHSTEQLYKAVDAQIAEGRQAYVICPLVSASEKLAYKNVQEEYERLQKTIFKHRRVGLLHGKLPADEKDAVMRAFAQHELDVLVATTVIEVGVDVPNATAMIIEGAERFGLAQLHQLRGRVGRSQYQSYCYLLPSTGQQPTQRLREVVRSDDGFYLAEADLKLRGPGELYGLRQHGALDLRMASITDTQMVHRVQKAVTAFLEAKPNLVQYPELYERVNKLQRVTVLN